ncbi:MAG: VCBS repeat-containing protein [Acidobacteria bacterium]|nr:VCBS repeat-containing protein [Acidobacteriota bacterium]
MRQRFAGMALFLFFATACAAQQKFPLRFLGEIGHLEPGQRLTLTRRITATGTGALIEGRDRKGKPWKVSPTTAGGIGWTSVWTADFDGDGQQDLLIEALFPGNGVCVSGASILLLIFDGNGRPVPSFFETALPRTPGDEFPFWPVHVTDLNKDRRAEFALVDCRRADLGPAEILSIRNILTSDPVTRQLRPVVNPNLAAYRKLIGAPLPFRPSPPAPARQPIGKPVSSVSSAFWRDWNKPATVTLGTLPPAPLPQNVILDGPDGREIQGGGVQALLRGILAAPPDAYRVRWRQGDLMWIDQTFPGTPVPNVPVQAELQVLRTFKKFQLAVEKPDDAGCVQSYYAPEDGEYLSLRRCGNHLTWTRTYGSTEEELAQNRPDRVRSSHTAFQHTVTTEAHFIRPKGVKADTLVARTDGADGLALAEWSTLGSMTPIYALHAQDGTLLEPSVSVPASLGHLLPASNSLVFYQINGFAQQVEARIVWKRGQRQP